MASFDSSAKKEISESAFEYLLAELYVNPPQVSAAADNASELAAKAAQLDTIGYNVGYRYAEKILSMQKAVGTEPLDVIKFVCKEFWEEVFKKKVDKLQTNHRGVFVLSDHKFKWLDKYASDDAATKQAATRMLLFPCGIIRGALASIGIAAVVNADFTTLPSCTFHIRIKPT